MNGGAAKVPIPNNVRKMIQNIKEIARNAGDDEIHGMLKECGMDPNEATQRLLALESFQEVRRKRDKRKENLNKEAVDSSRRSVSQGRGGKVYRGNYVSRVTNDSIGGKISSPGKDNLNKVDKNHPPSLPVSSEAQRKEPVSSSPPSGMANGIVNARYDNAFKKHASSEARSSAGFTTVGNFLLPVADQKTEVSDSSRGSGQISGKLGVPSSVKGLNLSSPGPRVATVGTVKREVRAQQKSGDNKRLSRDIPVGNATSPDKVSTESGELYIQGKAPIKSATTDRNQAMETSHSRSSSRPSSNYSNRSQQSMVSLKGVSSKEWKPKSANVVQAFGQFVIADASPDVGGLNSYLSPRTSSDESERSASMPHKKLEILNVSTEHVIIPQHLHVPESERGAFSFGSFNVNFEVIADTGNDPEGDKISSLTPELSHASEEHVDVPSLGQHALIAPLDGDNEDQELATHVPDSLSTEEINSLSTLSSEPHFDQSKQGSTPFAGPQPSAVQVTLGDSNLGLVTPVIGGQLQGPDNSEHQIRDATRLPSFVVQQPFDFSSNYYGQMYRTGVDSDGRFSPFFASSAHQNGQASHQENGNPLVLPNGGPTPLTAQATALLQSSMAMTQQPIPVFRQPPGVHISPYPQNYMPLNYFSSFYVPPMHHFMGNATFPQQPPAGSVFPTPVGATTTGKYPLPQYKPGNTSVNQSHILPAGYGPYTSTVAGYGPSIPAATTGNLTGSEDGSQYKDNTTGFIAGQQGEGTSTMWVPTPGRDLSGLPISSFYNLPPQGQHITFAPSQAGHSSFAGLYHPAQSATTATAHPLLQQPQTMAAASEMVGPSSGVYQQRPQINWANGY